MKGDREWGSPEVLTRKWVFWGLRVQARVLGPAVCSACAGRERPLQA